MEKWIQLIVLLLLILLTKPVHAQSSQSSSFTLKGQLIAEDQSSPYADYVIFARNSLDTTLLKTTFADSAGRFELTLVAEHSFFLSVEVRHTILYQSESMSLSASVELEPLFIENKTSALEEVNVVKRKPFIERANGKTILNVENSISSTGSSAFELIEKAPGVAIQNGDNIVLNGKQGIIVQIDGKRIPMDGSELANYLRGIASNNIEKIEFITNPSAKYDAAGVAIIDIKLKKDQRFGTNVTLNGSFGQGVYSKANGGITLNHRTKKITLFSNYNYAYRKGFNQLDLERNFYQNSVFTGAYVQKNYFSFPVQNHLLRAGFDYKINEKTTVSMTANGLMNGHTSLGSNRSDIIDENNVLNSKFTTESNSTNRLQSFSDNIHLDHRLDTLGTTISADFDYALYASGSTQDFDTRYFDLGGTEIGNRYLLNGSTKGNLSIYSLKTDFSKPFQKDNTLEAGLKSSYVVANNNLSFYNESSGVPIYDSTKSNHFIYTENINSAYVSVNNSYKKWKTSLGLRCENTNISGNQVTTAYQFDSSYVQLFPTFSTSYTLSENHQIDLNANRRIDRPSYGQLNPFKSYLDPTTYQAGNPYLRPQTTNTLEVGYLYKQKYYINAGLSRTLNNITEIIAPVEGQVQVTAQTMINLHHVDLYYSNITLPFDVTKWWNSSSNISGYLATYTGNAANTTLQNRGAFTYNIASTNTFQLHKNISAECTINYRAKEVYGYDVINPIWFMNVGMQAKVLKNQGTLRFSFTDVLFTNRIQANVNFTDYHEHFNVRRENSVGTLAFTYRFGNTKMQGMRRRDGGAEDLKSRS